uniref:NADH dehydrogenase subunit 2 n=1 Tax=Chrysops dissectus TaxID=2950936 RepID=UPI0022373AD5|nr:NADH dehydrogenase subunit 2 [Chrysops dissectus]UYG48428.1 NADH dehydrogenase subunit 2 [Chrysops dissectus]
MFKNSSKILFFSTLMMGTLITVSSNSWLSAWMGLEINLLSFIPLMIDTNNLMSTEASLKYFLTQALASSILLFAVIMSMLKFNFISQLNFNYSYSNLIILSSLMLKSGAAPFHFWFPGVMEGLSWTNNLILMTWQKIAPMMLISYIINKNFFIFIIIMSMIIGSLGGLNQTSLRKIMAFSSINHLGWMLAAMISSETLWLFYFLMYSFLSFTIVFLFNVFKLFHINQVFSLFFSSKILKFSLFMNLLSLGGLPPFLGFLPKWLVIQQLSMNYQLMLLIFMTSLTLITLYFYLRISYSAFMLNYTESNWFNNSNLNNFNMMFYSILSFISLFGLFIISMIYLTF